MVKNLLSPTLIGMVFYTLLPNAQAQEKWEHPVSAIRSHDGYILSINSDYLPLGMLLEEISEQCQLKVITYEEAILSQFTTVSFKDLPLDQGIKRLLKASCIKNYFLQYRNDPESRSSIAVLTLLGNGPKGGGVAISKDLIKKGTEKVDRVPLSSENVFAEKIAALKERYEWADEETEELAGHLLGLMPEPARGPGVEVLMKKLDRRIAMEGNDTVDENIFFQALEDTAPSHLAPVMMESIKHYSKRYKTGTAYESFEESPDELFQKVMETKSSQGMIP